MSITGIDSDDEDKWEDYVAAMTQPLRNETLLKIVGEGNTERVKTLLARGADALYMDGQALSIAAAGGHRDMLAVLLEKPFTVEQKSDALVTAVTAMRPEAVKILLEHRADPRKDNSIALWYTAMNGDTGMAHDLLQAGADANAHKKTLMGLALSHRHDGVAKELLHFGADPSATFKDRNAFEWAAEMHLEDFFQHLRSWVKSDIYMSAQYFAQKSLAELRAVMPDERNRTGLHMAASSGNFGVIRDKFIESGEKITLADLAFTPGPATPTVLDLLGQTGQIAIAFDAKLWAGRKEEMLQAFAAVPEAYRDQVDIKSAASTVDQNALKATLKSGARNFTLKP